MDRNDKRGLRLAQPTRLDGSRHSYRARRAVVAGPGERYSSPRERDFGLTVPRTLLVAGDELIE
jgi:hypothetical protein